MPEALLAPLAAWQNYYVIIGTAAARLSGLMFVAITLMAQLRVHPPSWSHMRVFNTSTVVHFGAALLIAALLSAPWPALWTAALLLGLAGLGGVSFVLIVLWEVRHRLVGYQLVRSDWLWYTLLPLISYTALVVAAILLPIYPGPVLFSIAAVTLLLLFMGIRNAWDVVTYMAIERSQPQDKPGLAQAWRRLACAGSSAVGKCRVERPSTMILTPLELSAKASLRMSSVVGEKRLWQSECS